MKKLSLWRAIGCGMLVTLLAIPAIWITITIRTNERRNELANSEYKKICREEGLLKKENKEKWKQLKRDVESGLVDSRFLRIHIPRYLGQHDHYQDILGPLIPIGKSNRLFRQKILVSYRSKNILQISDIIVVHDNLFSIYALRFVARSCYGELQGFDRVINHHYY